MTAAATAEKIGWIREAAGDRFDELEINTLPISGPAVITNSPHVFIGTVKDLTRKRVELRERFGISSFLILDLDTLAPVAEELAGH